MNKMSSNVALVYISALVDGAPLRSKRRRVRWSRNYSYKIEIGRSTYNWVWLDE